ncbi:hypothetical protein [Bradyrhizobium sp. ORS 285]|uniref:hypothetical protein n=1 Tax=Bradyrhizobium sp. ORS 285 TaxID=115808 RepID=UPI00111210D7|nr:hypothetical protein [Bradyrhizobium sp. ORS 285]
MRDAVVLSASTQRFERVLSCAVPQDAVGSIGETTARRRQHETCGSPRRMSSMDRRDMMLMAALLMISIVITLVGTEYVLDHVVMPLIDDVGLPSPDLPAR